MSYWLALGASWLLCLAALMALFRAAERAEQKRQRERTKGDDQ